MSDQRRSRLPASDRLPDVPFDPSGYHIVGRHLPGMAAEAHPSHPRIPTHEQPAWWEVDEPASLPDASDWRAVSVLAGVRRAARTSTATMRYGQPSWQSAFSSDVLDAYGLGDAAIAPEWTDDEIERERRAWRDDEQRGRPDGGKRGRRDRRGRRQRPNEAGDWSDH